MSQSPQLECGGGVGEGVSGTVANDDCRYILQLRGVGSGCGIFRGGMLCVGVEASASSFPCRRTSVTACFFRPRALNAGRRHLSPARGPLSLPPSRLMHPRYRPVEL